MCAAGGTASATRCSVRGPLRRGYFADVTVQMLTAGTLAAIAVLKISGRVAERRPRTMAARPERGLKQPGAQVSMANQRQSRRQEVWIRKKAY